MDHSLKPQPVMAQVLPGYFTLAILLYFCAVRGQLFINKVMELESGAAVMFGVLTFFAAWILGSFFDAIQNGLVETCWDRLSQDKDDRWWDFFFTGNREQVEQLHEYYYSYYELDINFAIASAITLVLSLCLEQFLVSLILLITAIIFFVDAKGLRKEIKRVILEHHGKKTQD